MFILGTAAVGWIFGLPERRPALHVAAETAATLVAVSAAYLLAGRFIRSRQLRHLLLATGFAILALANVISGATFVFVLDVQRASGASWAAMVLHVVGAATLAAAAFASGALVPRGGQHARLCAIAVLGIALAVAAAVLMGDMAIPVRVGEGAGGTSFHAEPVVVPLLVAAAALFALAAARFARGAVVSGDRVIGWVAGACALAAASRIAYVVHPTLTTDWISTADLLRLGFWSAVLAAAAAEVSAHWRALRDAAIRDERRRIAEHLHDGLAQELAYIRRNLGHLDESQPVVQRLNAASERALAEARQAIATLRRPLDEPFDVTLARELQEVAARFDTTVVVEGERPESCSPEQQQALLRIASEAVVNAARHSGTDRLSVELIGGPPLRLRVVDQGRGFDPGAVDPAATFGLGAMREQAAAVGAQLRIVSAPGRGTSVEAVL